MAAANNTEVPVCATLFHTHPPHGDDASSSFSNSASATFAHQITEKLTDQIFLLWREQIEQVVIKDHNLHRFLVSPQIPP